MPDRELDPRYQRNLAVSTLEKLEALTALQAWGEIPLMMSIAALPVKHLETLNAMLALLLAESKVQAKLYAQTKADDKPPNSH